MTTLNFEHKTLAVPVREEPAGVLRVGKSRVLLELVLHAFKAGATPESIVQSYDTLSLADVYAIGAAYLSSPAAFEDYLLSRRAAGDQTREMIEQRQGSQANLRAMLMARAQAREQQRAQAG